MVTMGVLLNRLLDQIVRSADESVFRERLAADLMDPTVLSDLLATPGTDKNWTPLILVLVVIAVGTMNANPFVRCLRSDEVEDDHADATGSDGADPS